MLRLIQAPVLALNRFQVDPKRNNVFGVATLNATKELWKKIASVGLSTSGNVPCLQDYTSGSKVIIQLWREHTFASLDSPTRPPTCRIGGTEILKKWSKPLRMFDIRMRNAK